MDNDSINPYELLDVPSSATDGDIKTAYRKKSLKVHPDRNPNNSEAAAKFHELNQAYELLLDPLRRLALDAKQRLSEAKKKRWEGYDKKRKEMVTELEEREREFKKRRMEKGQEEKKRRLDEERIKEEGRKMREKAMAQAEEQQKVQQQQEKDSAEEDEIPSLGPLDTTIRIKFAPSAHPTLTTPQSLSNLFSQFGAIDESLVILKPKKKTVSALIPFKQLGDAFAAVTSSGQASRGLEGIEVKWAAGKEGEEPPLLKWLKKMGKIGAPPPPPSAESPSKSDSQPFSSFPDSPAPPPLPSVTTSGMDYENLTLLRLRQAEKARLEREILEAEAREEEAGS